MRLAWQCKLKPGKPASRSSANCVAQWLTSTPIKGLLVAWAGFKGTTRAEARTSHLHSLWDAQDLRDQVSRSRLSLTRVWAVAPTDGP